MKNAFIRIAALFIGVQLVLLAIIAVAPAHAATMTDAEAKKQLALEATNIVSFGNPFGKTGKFEELYDPTGKPWWMVQLAKEAWSMETYGNPFGYPISQRVIGSPVPVLPVPVTQSPTQPVTVAPSPVQPLVPAPTPVEAPHFVGSPYFVSIAGQVSESAIAKGIAIRFSQPLPSDGPRPETYLLVCTSPEAVSLNTQRLGSENGYVRVAYVTDGNGLGHYSCKFRYTDPVNVESETIEFDL